MNEQEMVKRYIYEVVKRMPPDSKDDIRMELQALIEDMCAEEQITVEEALQKLGSPDEFANRYWENSNYLIGPEYYDNYLWVMKIALACIGISAIVSAVVNGILNADSAVRFCVIFFQELIASSITGCFSAVGIITIIFAVLQHQKAELPLNPKTNWSAKDFLKTAQPKSWTPGMLPPVPDQRIVISRGDSFVSIVFIILFSALLLFEPQLFGAFSYTDGKITSIACIFNLDQWQLILPVFLTWLSTGLIDEIVRLVTGYYCRIVMYTNIICNTIQVALAAVLLKILPLWNPDFAAQLKHAAGIDHFSKSDLLHYWESGLISNIFLILIILISIAETGITIYKTLKYTHPPIPAPCQSQEKDTRSQT